MVAPTMEDVTVGESQSPAGNKVNNSLGYKTQLIYIGI